MLSNQSRVYQRKIASTNLDNENKARKINELAQKVEDVTKRVNDIK